MHLENNTQRLGAVTEKTYTWLYNNILNSVSYAGEEPRVGFHSYFSVRMV